MRLSAGLHGTAAGLLALHPGWWPGLAAAVACDHLALGAVGLWPGCQWLGPVLRRMPDAAGTVALTFDDGPDPAVTPRVLDLLAARGARASFFCIAGRARRHPALVQRMLADGHRVENHTLTHPLHFALLAGAALRREVVDAQHALSDIAGAAPAWFRAPMGIRSPLLDPALTGAGLRLAGWSRRGYDTRCAVADTVLARLSGGVRPGDVLLLHDGNGARCGGRPVVLEVLPRLLSRLAASGLTAAALPGAPAAPAAAGGSPASA